MSPLAGNWLNAIGKANARRRRTRGLKQRRRDRRPLFEKCEDRASATSLLWSLPGIFSDGELELFGQPQALDPLAELLRSSGDQPWQPDAGRLWAGPSFDSARADPIGSPYPRAGEGLQSAPGSSPDAGFTQYAFSPPAEAGGSQFDVLLPPLGDALGEGEAGEARVAASSGGQHTGGEGWGGGAGGEAGGRAGGGAGGGGASGVGTWAGAEGELSSGAPVFAGTLGADAGGLDWAGTGPATAQTVASPDPPDVAATTSSDDPDQGNPALAESATLVENAAPQTSDSSGDQSATGSGQTGGSAAISSSNDVGGSAAPKVHSIVSAVKGGPSAPVLTAVYPLKHEGGGQLFVQGTVDTHHWTERNQRLEFYVLRGRSAERVGETNVAKSPTGLATFRSLLDASLGPNSTLVAHLVDRSGDGIGPVSLPSRAATVFDQDVDGVYGDIERLAPHGGDGNRDGIPDSRQASVATIPAATMKDFLTLDAKGRPLNNVRVSRLQGNSATEAMLPFGLMSFDIVGLDRGGRATVELILPDGARPDAYLKLDPIGGTLQRFDFDGTTGATIHDNIVTLYLVDGGRGDADGVANGVIVDPSGPAFSLSDLIPGDLDEWEIVESGGSEIGHGTVTVETGELNNSVVIREGDSFLVSLERDVTIPQDPVMFRFVYEASFDTSDEDSINDAFEVALLDADGVSVVGGFQTERDAYFNLTEEEPARSGAGVTRAAQTVDLDIEGRRRLHAGDTQCSRRDHRGQ